MNQNRESNKIGSESKSNRESREAPQTNEQRGDEHVTVDQLYNELRSNRSKRTEKDVRLTPEQQSELILERVSTALFVESGFRFDESVVKQNLDEILLLLVAHRSSDTHGKRLMGDLATIFNTRLSPGTVYPQLHNLEDDDLLRVQELVRTKEYQINSQEEVADQVSSAMEQHLTLGLFYKSALAELS